MRQRAQAAGNLQNTPQETVSYDQGNIEVAPANPQVVYVPAYNPWAVYGQPMSPYPGFSLLGALGSFLGSALVSFGPGLAMTAFSHTPFGLLGWGLSWLAQTILFNHATYFSHSTTVADWGFAHGAGAPLRALTGGEGGYGRGGYSARLSPGVRAGTRKGLGSTGLSPPGPCSRHTTTCSQRSIRRIGRPPTVPVSPAVATTTPQWFYGNSQPVYRAPATGFHRTANLPNGLPRLLGIFGNKGYSGYKAPSGGFHLFGGGHSEKSFGGGKSSVAAEGASEAATRAAVATRAEAVTDITTRVLSQSGELHLIRQLIPRMGTSGKSPRILCCRQMALSCTFPPTMLRACCATESNGGGPVSSASGRLFVVLFSSVPRPIAASLI